MTTRLSKKLLTLLLLLSVACATKILKKEEDFTVPKDFEYVGEEVKETDVVEREEIEEVVVIKEATLPDKAPGEKGPPDLSPERKIVKKKVKRKVVKKRVKKVHPETRIFMPKKKVAIPKKLPFKDGERLQYLLTYFNIKGGLVTMEIRNPMVFKGRPVFHLYGHVLSSFVMNFFYRVDDYYRALVDRETFAPLRGQFSLNESVQIKQRVVFYEHGESRARFWSKMQHKKKGNQEIRRTDPMLPNSQEMYSAFYYVRIFAPKVGQTIKVPIYENGKNYVAAVKGLKEETIRTKLGKYRCTKYSIKNHIGGALEQKGDIFLWLSNEPDRAMIKFTAKINLGEIKGQIIRRGTTAEPLSHRM